MIELNKIYNEDCITGLKRVEDNSIDLILTSPPYNIGIDYDNYTDSLPWKEYYEWCELWLRECFRVLKYDGRIAINHYLSLGNSSFRTSPISEINTIMNEIGFKHHTIAVWTDITLSKRTAWGSFMKASAPYINSPFEGILIDYKEKWKKEKNGVSDISKDEFVKLTRGIWDIKTETRGLTKANFSLDFATKAIKLLSYQDDIVLDPFMGSGTTALACLNNKRKFVGFELSPKYTQIANERIAPKLWQMENGF